MAGRRKAVARLLSQSSKESNAAEKHDGGRSGRNSHDRDPRNEPNADEEPEEPIRGAGVLPKEHEMDRSSVGTTEIEEQKDIAEEGVNQAIEDLAKMERRLQRAVKRQKIKIEESTITAPKDTPAQRAFKPRTAKNRPEPAREDAPTEHLPTPERDAQGSEYEDVGEASARPSQEGVPEAAERGAARPPPVNSDVLPLPWKGRLGYVGPPQAGAVPR